MEYILFAIPFITAIILLLFFHKNVVWWEYILLIVPPILLTLVFKCIMVEVNTMDTEYYGGYVTRVTHYDDLVEYADLLAKDIPTKWIRKEFEDFNYLSVEVSKGEYIVLFIIMMLLEIGLSIFVVKNEIDNKEK